MLRRCRPRQYALVRCAAALTGDRVAELCCAWAEAAVFYGQYVPAGTAGDSLLLPALVDPSARRLMFALGSGWLLGQIRPWLVYVWMAVPFLCMALPLPDALGIWNGQFFQQVPI